MLRMMMTRLLLLSIHSSSRSISSSSSSTSSSSSSSSGYSSAFLITTPTPSYRTLLLPTSQQQQLLPPSSSFVVHPPRGDPVMNHYPHGIGSWSITRLAASINTNNNDDATTTTTTTTKKTKDELQQEMSECLFILNQAANTKQIDANVVYQALITLEQLARQCNKIIPTKDDNGTPTEQKYEYAQQVQEQLTGSWRLIFTTGTVETQTKLGNKKINYFPIKAIQTFNTTTHVITNAIYIGDFVVLQFCGTYTFDVRKCQVQFDFDTLQLFQNFITIPLSRGQAAEFGASTGLGSESNVINVQTKNKSAFFNWISADDNIATARGGGGGLALWKRNGTMRK